MLPVCFVSELKHLGVCVCVDARCRVVPKPTGSRTLAGVDEGNAVPFVLPRGLHLCTAPPVQRSTRHSGAARIQSLHHSP